MHSKIIATAALAFLTSLIMPALAGQEPKTTAASAPTAAETAVSPEAGSLRADLDQLVGKIKTRLRAGARTEEALAGEIKDFDALLAAHKDAQPEELAGVLMMKAALYIEVIQDAAKAEVLVQQLKAEYPQTGPGRQADAILVMLEQRKEKEKIKAAFVPGAAFPDFDEKDMKGDPLSISKFKGRVVLVDFWATWCGPCVNELPVVQAAYEKYHGRGFEIIGISLDKDLARLKAFIETKQMNWPQYFDGKGWQNKLAVKYGIDSIPATFLLDREGRIVARNLRGSALEAELEKLFGK